jgi:thioredoxin 1
VYKPVLEEVMTGFADVEFQKVDVDDESQLAADHAIRSIPTTMMFKEGKEIFRQTGPIGKAWLTNYIENNK